MKIYNTTANFENDFFAIEWCKGMDFSEIETTEGEMPKHSNFIDEVEGVEIYYCYGTDSYFFAEVEEEEKIYLCKCNKCGESLKDNNPSGESNQLYIKNGDKTEYKETMYLNDSLGAMEACPNCKTDAYLTDLIK